MNRTAWWLAVLWAAAARAQGEFELRDLLARPGVRAVAVEFYADWCQACQEEMPRWRRLKELYGGDGLRIVFVNETDPDDPSRCEPPRFSADVVKCDVDAALARKFGVTKDLPRAFLWSWQRHLLVESGRVGDVEAAVEKFFRETPRVLVEAAGEVPEGLLSEVAEELTRDGKVQVVASEAERARLKDLLLGQSQDLLTAEESRCELGKILAANMRLVVSVQGGQGLLLKLQRLETGCVVKFAKAAWDPAPAARARAVRDAVANLVAALQDQLQEPAAASKPPQAAPTAADLSSTIAIADFGSQEAGVAAGEMETLADAVRSSVAKEVGTRYALMDGVTLRGLTPPEQRDCLSSACAKDVARQLRPAFLLTGVARRFGTGLVLKLETYDGSGRFVGSEQFRGRDVEALLGVLESHAGETVRPWLGLPPKAPRAAPPPPASEPAPRPDTSGAGRPPMPAPASPDIAPAPLPDAQWIISVGAFPTAAQADAFISTLARSGHAGVRRLWIPDFGSLSGKALFATFVGPFAYDDRDLVRARLAEVRRWSPDAYAVKLAATGPREELRR
jgi:thiol-disulfide isomerase/thioredoxin